MGMCVLFLTCAVSGGPIVCLLHMQYVFTVAGTDADPLPLVYNFRKQTPDTQRQTLRFFFFQIKVILPCTTEMQHHQNKCLKASYQVL